MRRLVSVLVLGVAALGAGGCGDPGARWEPGGIYSISDGGEFGVVKILAIDPGAVSIRVYRERFPNRPGSVDPDNLTLGGVDDPEGFGIGHLPLAPRDFALWFPVQLTTQPVIDEELEGYRYWKESGGGAFSFSEMTAPDESDAGTPSEVQQ